MVRPKRHRSHMRVRQTDETSTLLAAYRTVLGLNAKEIFTSHFFSLEYQFICSEICILYYNQSKTHRKGWTSYFPTASTH